LYFVHTVKVVGVFVRFFVRRFTHAYREDGRGFRPTGEHL
jgi:hypothetical protein